MISEWLNDIYYAFVAFSFVPFTLIVGLFIALSSSLLGVTLVLKQFSFIGQGLSNVAFGAIAIASALSFTSSNNFLFVLPVTVISAVLLLRTGKNAKVKGDAAVAMISVGSLAIGYLIMQVFPTSQNVSADVCSTLFGSRSLLILEESDILLTGVLSAIVVVVFLMFYHNIFSATFDEDFATGTGTKARTYNLILSIIIAVVIVVAVEMVGTMLISALVIFPALSAMRVFKSFLSVTICSVVVSLICMTLGILISIPAETPVSATIVAAYIACFGLFSVTGVITKKVFR